MLRGIRYTCGPSPTIQSPDPPYCGELEMSAPLSRSSSEPAPLFFSLAAPYACSLRPLATGFALYGGAATRATRPAAALHAALLLRPLAWPPLSVRRCCLRPLTRPARAAPSTR